MFGLPSSDLLVEPINGVPDFILSGCLRTKRSLYLCHLGIDGSLIFRLDVHSNFVSEIWGSRLIRKTNMSLVYSFFLNAIIAEARTAGLKWSQDL